MQSLVDNDVKLNKVAAGFEKDRQQVAICSDTLMKHNAELLAEYENIVDQLSDMIKQRLKNAE